MAQALLDIYANADNCEALEVGEIRYTTWSGVDIDTRHISQNTFALIEMDFEWAIEDCEYRNGKKLRLQQLRKSHYLYFILAVDSSRLGVIPRLSIVGAPSQLQARCNASRLLALACRPQAEIGAARGSTSFAHQS